MTSDTEAWAAAEFEYGALQATLAMSTLGGEFSVEDKVQSYANMLETCPTFYPALIEMGLEELRLGKNKVGVRRILRGADLCFEHVSREQSAEAAMTVADNLETLWRHDIACTVLPHFIARLPEVPELKMCLARAEARTGNAGKAVKLASEVLQTEFGDADAWSELATYELMAGNLDAARRALAKAFETDPAYDDERNIEDTVEWMEQTGGTFDDFRIRPADRERLARYEEEGLWDEAQEEADACNQMWMVAWAIATLRDRPRQRHLMSDRVETLATFLRFARQVGNDIYGLDDDCLSLLVNLRAILHKLIFKHRDADEALLHEIFTALTSYYDFLAASGLVDADDLRELRKLMRKLEPEMIGKARSYAIVRRDTSLTEDEKEAIRGALFEGDHEVPFL